MRAAGCLERALAVGALPRLHRVARDRGGDCCCDVDEALATSAQQWALRSLGVGAAVASLLAVTAATGEWWGFGLVSVALLAGWATVRPDGPGPVRRRSAT